MLKLEVGRVLGDYIRFRPGIALPGITRTRPFKYGRIRILGICVDFLRLSTIPHAVKRKVAICLATIFDARHCGVTRDR